jgi:periplasmic protein TonB
MNCASMCLTTVVVALATTAGWWPQGPTTEPKPLAGNQPPLYPPEAREDAVIGRVAVRATIGKDGKVKEVDIEEATPTDYRFKEAAIKAVKAWRFDPALASGSPATGVYKVAFTFAPKDPVPISTWFNMGASPIASTGESVTLKGASGWARTSRWFSDFELDLEFRILEPGSRAGLLVRARPNIEGRRASYRINLSDAVDGSEAVGRIVNTSTPGRDQKSTEEAFHQSQLATSVKPIGEWQTLRILASNDELRTIVNGRAIAAARVSERTGHIGLDGANGRVEVRHVVVRRRDTYFQPLPAPGGDLQYVNLPGDKKPPAGGVVPPKLVTDVKPDYSFEAMRRIRRGMVYLEAIVMKDGSIGPIHVTKSLDLDLDQASVASVRQWTFAPATKDGQPVAFRAEIEMSFTLK